MISASGGRKFAVYGLLRLIITNFTQWNFPRVHRIRNASFTGTEERGVFFFTRSRLLKSFRQKKSYREDILDIEDILRSQYINIGISICLVDNKAI